MRLGCQRLSKAALAGVPAINMKGGPVDNPDDNDVALLFAKPQPTFTATVSTYIDLSRESIKLDRCTPSSIGNAHSEHGAQSHAHMVDDCITKPGWKKLLPGQCHDKILANLLDMYNGWQEGGRLSPASCNHPQKQALENPGQSRRWGWRDHSGSG